MVEMNKRFKELSRSVNLTQEQLAFYMEIYSEKIIKQVDEIMLNMEWA